MTIAEKLFEASNVQSELEDQLCAVGVPCERIGWDYYDCSLELYDVPDDYRLSPEAQEVIHKAGFGKVYVNHLNKWETHYTFPWCGAFNPKDGWRVSYPHRRQDSTAEILVEKPVASWPADWFETGYAKVVGASPSVP